MNTYFLGASMLDNELTILPAIVAIGFVGWLMLMIVQVVWLSGPSAVNESGLDEYGCYYDEKQGGYYCVTGRFAGRVFADKEEMLKEAA